MPWQKDFTLSEHPKGCHLVTDEVISHIRPGLRDVKIGILYLFIQHTSAALAINENFDPGEPISSDATKFLQCVADTFVRCKDVRKDMDMALDNIVPVTLNWKHGAEEGPDDSASHTKTALIGTSLQIPITDGHLNLGSWQGIYLAEFRELPHVRKVVATIL
ncbi:hypothetical protein ACEPAG_721 [Sanghuangporus baumii]